MQNKSRAANLLMWIISLLLSSFSGKAQSPSDSTAFKELYATIAKQDSLLFVAFNNCDVRSSQQFFTEDLEFYHDAGGLTNYAQNMQSIVDRCNKPYKVRRALVDGSMAVYPIKNYGAIQTGKHHFYYTPPGKSEVLDGTFQFLHIWRLQDGKWKIARVASFDH